MKWFMSPVIMPVLPEMHGMTSQPRTVCFRSMIPYSVHARQTCKKEEIAALNKSYEERAIAACKDADAVIYVGGLNHDFDVEDRDRSDYHLPYGQDALIKKAFGSPPGYDRHNGCRFSVLHDRMDRSDRYTAAFLLCRHGNRTCLCKPVIRRSISKW